METMINPNGVNSWVHMDDIQWVKQISDSVFHVLDGTRYPDGQYTLTDLVIDVSSYSQEELENHVSGYYDSFESLKSEVGDEWRQIIAEIVAEQTTLKPNEFFDQDTLAKHLMEIYGIQFS